MREKLGKEETEEEELKMFTDKVVLYIRRSEYFSHISMTVFSQK